MLGAGDAAGANDDPAPEANRGAQATGSSASGSRYGLLLRDSQITRPFPLSILSPGFTGDYSMKVALIGASGNVGQRLHSELLSRGHDVTAMPCRP